MGELIIVLIFLAIVLFALAGVFGAGVMLHIGSKREDGWLHWGVYGMLLTTAIMIATTGRNISSETFLATYTSNSGLSPLAAWVTRFTSVAFVLVATERILRMVIRASAGHRDASPPMLMIAFVVFWLGTVASPAFLSDHPHFDHEGVYTLVIGVAFILSSMSEADKTLIAARNGLVIMNLAGYVAAVIQPQLVLDFQYQQGFIPGMPRFTGLTPHALTLGIVVQIGMFCLWVKPFSKRWLNILAWVAYAASLVLAQSKTAWISLALCILIMGGTSYRSTLSRLLLNPVNPWPAATLLMSAMALISAMVLGLMFSDVDRALNHFLASEEGASVSSLTGRDIIWEVAFEEWWKHPVFGYGPSLFDVTHRAQIGLPNATHAHNQYVDTLARAGSVGAISLVLYVLVLAFWSVRYATSTQGLSALLFLALFIRSIGEVPFSMVGYGVEFLGHVLLLACICGAHKRQLASSLNTSSENPSTSINRYAAMTAKEHAK